jgi:hypothetical protein
MRNVEACTSRDQLADLAPFWDKLDTYLNAPFGSYHWILSCAETLATDAELLIPVIRENDGTPRVPRRLSYLEAKATEAC